MKKWEKFEEYLFERDLLGEEFNVHALADDWGISGREASSYIQCYLGAQRRQKANTLFVLKRRARTRTTTAMWSVGERAADVRGLGAQLSDDLKTRIAREIAPSMRRIAQKNPRALPAAEAVAKGIEAGVDLMAALVED